MRFAIQDAKRLADRLRWDDLDLGGFEDRPLEQGALRCLRYMHDVEFHTACYLRDLLVSPAHADPDLTSFLSIWAFEELWHGEALAAVLHAHGESSGKPRVHVMRQSLGPADRIRPLVMLGGSWLAGENLLALQMAWGAINEMTTQAGYALLGAKAANPLLSALLKRIMVQEGRHMDFYASQAHARLAKSAPARRLTRTALRWLWSPVGSKVMPSAETDFLVRYLFSDPQAISAIRRIDRRIDRLPGLDGMRLTGRWFERFSAREPFSASSDAEQRPRASIGRPL